MIETAQNVYRCAFRDALRPPPIMTTSEWADAHRVLDREQSAEPGRWKTSRVPYLREIMDALSPFSGVEKIVFMKGSQIAGTSAGENAIGHAVHLHPGPIMIVFPTGQLAEDWSQTRLRPMLESTPALRNRISDRPRDASNTMLLKQFPGGLLAIVGANSGVGLRSKAIRMLFLSEIDGYPMDVDGEGAPADLAENRTNTFGARRKIYKESTPKTKGTSAIEREFEKSDQRYYHLPCPHCGHKQALRWEQMRYDYDKELGVASHVVYECEECKAGISEHRKTEMLEAGEWIPKFPGRPVRGYHLSTLYSPLGWISWSQLAVQYEKARDDEGAMKVFANTKLGLAYEEKGDAPEWNRLYERRESYPIGKVPAGACLLTAFADVQKDRIEVEVKGWGENLESWSIDYRVIPGSPPELLDASKRTPLDDLLEETFERADGGLPLRIHSLGVDSGYATQDVYAWVRKHSSRRVYATKGSDSLPAPIGHPTLVDINQSGKRIRRGVALWPIGASVLKGELYRNLRRNVPKEGEAFPRGYCHFPAYDQEYFQQLTAEQQVKRIVKGYPRQEWQKTRERNEALDCHVGNRAIATVAGVERMQPHNWAKLRAQLGIKAPEPRKAPVEDAEAEPVAVATSPTPSAPPASTSAPKPRPSVHAQTSGRRIIRSRFMGRR